MADKSEFREYLEAFGIAVVLAVFIIVFIAQSFLVQGSSMEPNLHNGERLLVDKVTYRFRAPRRGEVVVFKNPTDPRRKFIKRIIGLPGDKVEIRDNHVFLNGERLDEPYVLSPTLGPYGQPKFPAAEVPEGKYFVLGDNRNNSDDSRYPDVGFVPRENFVGRALILYWPVTRAGILRVPAAFQ